MSVFENHGQPHNMRSLTKRTRGQLWSLLTSYRDAVAARGGLIFTKREDNRLAEYRKKLDGAPGGAARPDAKLEDES